MRCLVILCASLALAGCADESGGYLARNDQLAEKRLRNDYQDDIGGPDFAALRGRIDLTESFRHDIPACQGIADGRPMPVESAALRRWIELRTAYFLGTEALQIRAAAVSEKMAPTVHGYLDIIEYGRKRSTDLISDLADGQLTYCQFAEADKALTDAVAREAAPLHFELAKAQAAREFDYPVGMSEAGLH